MAAHPAYAQASGVPGIEPHDCRCYLREVVPGSAWELEQIQLLLGQASVRTMERHLGTRQDLVYAA